MRARALASTAVVAFLAACGGETVVEVTTDMEPFVGVWGAASFELVALDGDPPSRVELIRNGVTVTVEIRGDGRFIILQTVPGRDEVGVDRGNLEVLSATARVRLDFDDSDDPLVGSFVFEDQGRILTLTLPEASFDFDGDGIEEPARSRLILLKLQDGDGEPVG